MAQDYNEYLAISVLNEQQLITYRSLSRALKVHCNLAKQMLYEFYRKQNAKRPGTVHATYLLTGTRLSEDETQTNGTHSQDDEDTVMASSPPLPSSSMPHPEEEEEAIQPNRERCHLLVKEEHLDKAKATFKQITGIHVYSLQANGLSDFHSLTECNRKIGATYGSENPLVDWKQYGTIQNPNVRVRKITRVPPPPAPAAKAKPAPATTKPTVLEKQASKASTTSAKSTPEPEKESTTGTKRAAAAATKPTAIKRQKSDIFKAFAKGANQPKKPAATKATPAPPPPQDEPMGGMSDDDPGDVNDEAMEELPLAGKTKKDREAELKAMMDAEDEPMGEAAEEEEDTPAAETPKEEPKVEEPKETVTVENGRRRGRRRVMKKKTVKDAEGYLVTREEAAWESFSEDEPVPKKTKPPPPAAKPAGKKGATAKAGQGNIMSFFSKK